MPFAIQRALFYILGSRFTPFCTHFGIPWFADRSGLWLDVLFSTGNQLALLRLVAWKLVY